MIDGAFQPLITIPLLVGIIHSRTLKMAIVVEIESVIFSLEESNRFGRLLISKIGSFFSVVSTVFLGKLNVDITTYHLIIEILIVPKSNLEPSLASWHIVMIWRLFRKVVIADDECVLRYNNLLLAS